MLVPDTRGERTRRMVMSEEHYNQIFERSVPQSFCPQSTLPASVGHQGAAPLLTESSLLLGWMHGSYLSKLTA